MRAILLILILAIVALIGAVAIGLVDFTQTRPATAPSVKAEDGAIRARAGQTPAFEVETGSVAIGTKPANVAVPQVQIRRGETQVRVPNVEVRRPADAPANSTAP